jgi:type IV secretion system protein VirB6
VARDAGIFPMNAAWGFFLNLDRLFDVNFLNGVQALLSALVTYVHAPLLAGTVVWLAGTFMVDHYAPGGIDPMTGLVRRLTRAAIIVFAVSSAATFNQYVGNLLLNILPTDVGNAVANASGNPPIGANAFDTLWNGAWAAGEQVYKNIPGWSFKGLGMMIVVALYWGIALGTIAISFLIYVASRVFLGLVVATGPLFVCCLLWQRTARFFDGWVGAAGSLIVTQIFIVALLTLWLRVETEIIRQIAGQNVGVNANNEASQVQLLLESGGMFFIAACLAKQLPDLARAIMGGIAHNTAPYTRAVMSTLGGTAGAAVGGVAGGPMGAVTGGAVGAEMATSGVARAIRLVPAGKAM